MSIEHTCIVINDMQNSLQEIESAVSRIATLLPEAVEKQDNPAFARRLYLDSQKLLTSLIEIEHATSGYADYLRQLAGGSFELGKDTSNEQPREPGKMRGGN